MLVKFLKNQASSIWHSGCPQYLNLIILCLLYNLYIHDRVLFFQDHWYIWCSGWRVEGKALTMNEVSVYWRSASLIGEGGHCAVKFWIWFYKAPPEKNGLNTFDITVVNMFSKRKPFTSHLRIPYGYGLQLVINLSSEPFFTYKLAFD